MQTATFWPEFCTVFIASKRLKDPLPFVEKKPTVEPWIVPMVKGTKVVKGKAGTETWVLISLFVFLHPEQIDLIMNSCIYIYISVDMLNVKCLL